MVTVTNARPGPVAVQLLREGMASRPLLCPFDLQMWVVDRMLNFEIVDDPIYEGPALLVFDDPAQGTGMIVLLKRRQDRRFDIYRQPGLTLDPELAQVGGELGAWVEADIDPARFDISHDGVDVDVRFADRAGRARWWSSAADQSTPTGSSRAVGTHIASPATRPAALRDRSGPSACMTGSSPRSRQRIWPCPPT